MSVYRNILCILIAMVFAVGCESKLEEMSPTNPFDPNNPETNGDPFHLTATATDSNIMLNWHIPDIFGLKEFYIYRSREVETGYIIHKMVGKSSSTITDKDFDTIGTYWYKMAAVNVSAEKSMMSNHVSAQITVTPRIKIREGFVLVEGGTFIMGDTWGGGISNELPVHSVTLISFYISKYEVSQARYLEVMGSNPSSFSGDNLPVETVSWYDAVTFCNTLSIQEGLTPCYAINGTSTTCDFTANGYRLPTEAEWEYAARGGNQSQGYKFSGSDNVDDVAWNSANSGSQTHLVGTKQANELGIYDMSGNVWEWCWDWWGNYTATAQTNPTGPSSGTYRVLRGGSWYNYFDLVRVAYRGFDAPTGYNYGLGFRISRTK